ncbi:hypothetical protein V6C27_02630 [Peptococcaceae bacterium 1198_IL3148]
MSTNNLSQVEPGVLLELINHYDQYIQKASKNQCYQHGDWEPMTIEDYYDTEFQLVLKTTAPMEVAQQIKEQTEQPAVSIEEKPSDGWSTFSKHELLKPKRKPWWRKLLPW